MRRDPHLGASQATGQGEDAGSPFVSPLQEEPNNSSAQSTVGYQIKSAAHVQFKNNEGSDSATSLSLTGTRVGCCFTELLFQLL